MKRILATYIKEWHLMRRDLSGLALLFIMPVLLIIIMALVQDAPFKDYKDQKFKTLPPEQRVTLKTTDCISDYSGLKNSTCDMVNEVGLI